MQVTFECVYVIESQEGEAFGGEENAVLSQRAADEIVCCGTGNGVCEWVGGEPSGSVVSWS